MLTPKQARELHIVRFIKEKLRTNTAIITKADKGNSIVISYGNNYERKVHDFIYKNGTTERATRPLRSREKLSTH